jgi:UDP-3-O-[3-hydroxymyristoyl] N-acetylglucosamine deacetylase/3-hydroxyacyl-[acyl-carrier-protein] dehydratase
MALQKTIKKPVELQGKGFIHNRQTTVRLLPAEPDSGIVLVRTDLSGARLAVSPKTQQPRPNCSSITSGNISVEVVEHLLAACSAFGIANLEVELDGPELPAFDGSAKVYSEQLSSVGVVEQDAPLREIRFHRPLAVHGDNGAVVVVLPDEQRRFSFVLDYSQYQEIGVEYVSVDLDAENLADTVLPARSFIMEEEARIAQEKGLIGATDESMGLVVRAGTKPELRMPGEFARHKILDMMGDMHVLGRRLNAHILGVKSGHKLNAKLVQAIAARYP